MLPLNYIFGQYHAAPWGVLLLCFIWLWLKREEILKRMELRIHLLSIAIGFLIFIIALLMPLTEDFILFQLLLAYLSIFIIFFGNNGAAIIPSILLVIYGFSISFPMTVEKFAEMPYSMSTTIPALWLMEKIGYPLQNQGQLVSFTSLSGEHISVLITTACAGPATMGVFIAIFALTMLDLPLPLREASGVFCFGAAGTWFQSIIRLIIIFLTGYHWGKEALFTAHFWTIYILFPLWYLIFLYVYFYVYGHNLPKRKRK